MSIQGPCRHCRALRGSISWGHQNAERCHFLMEQCQLGSRDRICTTPCLISPGNTQATFGKPRECWEPRAFRLPLSVPGRLWAWRRKSAARMEGEAPPPRTHAGQTRPRPMLEGEGVVSPQPEHLLVEGRASISGAVAPGST